MKKRFLLLITFATLFLSSQAKEQIRVTPLARNAVRIQYGTPSTIIPDWTYVGKVPFSVTDFKVDVNQNKASVTITNKNTGRKVFKTVSMSLTPSTVQGEPTNVAEMTFTSLVKGKEFQYGLGQFQDGFTNVFGLSRRLTQVNTQIAVPMLLSSKGYGVLWNNYGLTEFNPGSKSVTLTATDDGDHKREVVDVTSTTGNRREVRESNAFAAQITIDKEGDYTLLLDVGQQMARKHYLTIDDKPCIDANNMWLPPTASTIVHLTQGTHKVYCKGSRGDKPVLFYEPVDDNTQFRSPVADCVDFTVFLGTPDEIISTYRLLTGPAAPMPDWALGYIHCRERFHSSEEILSTAQRFKNEQIPLDMIVQDWQWWGKYGWNAMQFDEQYYPDPRALTDSLHKMGVRMMLSVWSKIDQNCEVGKEARQRGYYIPGTDWIDFFNKEASTYYWKNFSQRLLPTGIDAWWQDATEPENDDLLGRKIQLTTDDGVRHPIPGEMVRNVYPLMVCRTVYEGLRNDVPERPAMILTRSGFSGIQRYGAALWSGDIGNDWQTLRRQISGGLGLMAAGIPWWTYDAGGFFRPGNQYSDKDYINRMLRWIQTSVFLPLMRVHGYMSNTEPWNYGPEAQKNITEQIRLRHKLLPYIKREAEAVTRQGGTLMRPLVFDFSSDEEALGQDIEYMFGHSLLVCPIVEPDAQTVKVYLPTIPPSLDGSAQRIWTDFWSGRQYTGGQYITIPVTLDHIPVFSLDPKLVFSQL